MASFSKFNTFVADIANKKHNLGADQITIALTDTLPTSANAVLADITQIAYTNIVNGSTTGRNVTTTSSTQSSGTYKLILQNLVLTSATGDVAQFRYVVIYNSTASGGPLIGWYDYGSEVILHGANGDSFTVSFDAVNGLLQIA